jgi:hypothetical protein
MFKRLNRSRMLELGLSAAVFLAATVASAHAVIYKREPRAAALKIVIWLIPAVGPIFYFLLESIAAASHCDAPS